MDSEPPTAAKREKIMAMLEQEIEYKTELFAKLTDTCYNKCIDKRYKEGELFIGENTCIDRCVSKYSQVTAIFGQLLKSGGSAK